MTHTPYRLLRRLLAGAAVSLTLALAPLSAMADFSGAFAPANWTTTLLGSPAGGGGASVDTSLAPASIKIIGGDSVSPGGPESLTPACTTGIGTCEIRYTITAPTWGAVNFDWAYTTTDPDGPGLDLFLVVNGVPTQLSDNAGAATQGGTHSLTVPAGQTFGFALNCRDCIKGAAEVVVSNFSFSETSTAPVPTLSEWAMALLAALMALSAGMLVRGRRIG